MTLTTGNWSVSDLLRSPLQRTSRNCTTSNRSVNDLLRGRRRTLSWEKTLWTSNNTARHWNVNGLLEEIKNRRHFHHMFQSAAREEPRGKDKMNKRSWALRQPARPSGDPRVEKYPSSCPPLRHRCIEKLHHGSNAHEVGEVLHNVPLNPLLRSKLNESLGPQSAVLFL